MKPNPCPGIFCAILLAIAAGLSGCSAMMPHTAGSRPATAHLLPNDQQQRIDILTRALLSLSPEVSENEARDVAQSAITHTALLGKRYRVVRPPELHNILVKIGWKQRGLCYHWTEDLLQHLQELSLRHLRFQRVVAHRGSNLHEHHSVIVTTAQNAFEQGIVLDGWRNSGMLYWSPVGDDRLPWKPLHGKARAGGVTDDRQLGN